MVRRRAGREGGHILLLSLLVVVLLTGALLLIAGTLQARMKLVRRETQVLRLTALTDAVLAETLAHLAVSPGYGGVPEREFGGGRMASEVEPGGGALVILARAEFRERRRTVRAVARPTVLGPVVLDWRVVVPEAQGAAVRRSPGRHQFPAAWSSTADRRPGAPP